MKQVVRSAIQFFAVMSLLLAASHAAHAQMPSNCVAGTNIYYIDNAGGSDSNSQAQAKNKSTAWAHQPYMASFTGQYAHSAGDCFVFKGGDTWVASDMPLKIQAGGGTSEYDYYGVDQSWYNGSSWTRPKFDAQNTTVGNVGVVFDPVTNISGLQFDNFEIVNVGCSTSVSTYVFVNNQDDYISMTNNYVHSFYVPSGGCGDPNSGTLQEVYVYASYGGNSGSRCHGVFDHNIVNGADGTHGSQTPSVTVQAIIPNVCIPLTNNVVHDVCSALNAYTPVVAYNLIYNIGPWSSSVGQCNPQYHPDGIQTDSDSEVHDNVLYHVTGEAIQLTPGNGNSQGATVSHVYNNVLYANTPTAIELGTGGDASSTNGVAYIYNNTLECDSAAGAGCLSMYVSISSLTIENNHLITSSGGAEYCVNSAPFNCAGSGSHGAGTLNYTASSEVYQTMSAANGQGYSASEQFAYSPTSSTGSTVGKGANLSSACSATVFICSTTSYGSTANSLLASVFADTITTRPNSGSWDAGAYLFGGAAASQPNPPTGLTAIVQ